MKKRLIFFLTVIVLVSCEGIPSMKQEVVNALDLNEIPLISTSSKGAAVDAEFFYGNRTLYISDKKNNRVVAVDENNKIFYEIGHLQKTQAMHSQDFWDKELKKLLAEVDDKDTVLSKKSLRKTPRSQIHEKYEFKKIGKVISDFDENVYVIHYEEKGMKILKFGSDGKFKYYLGESGRDSPDLFSLEAKILSLHVSSDNMIWVKYFDQGMIKIISFSKIGKSYHFFEEKKINKALTAHLNLKEGEYHQVEDIFPLTEERQVGVVLNIYAKKNGRFQVARKMFFQLNRNYGVENYWAFKDTRLQVFNVNLNQNLVCFSYSLKNRIPILKVYNLSGKQVFEKRVTLQRFNYSRVVVGLTQNGELLGGFRKKNMIFFVIWK